MIATVRLFAPSDASQELTVRDFYQDTVLPVIQHEQSPRSLAEDRIALNHWERITGDPAIRKVNRDHITQFRDGLLRRKCSPGTVNKYWREIKAILSWASAEQVIGQVPSLSHRSTSRLIKEQPKRQRESLSDEEVTALYLACKKATYPAGGQVPAPKLWRTAIVLWWHYGARTLDVVRELTWDNVHFEDRLLKFTAMKTRKLQGLPLTDLVIEHLNSIKRSSHQIFAGFQTTGHYSRKRNRWKRGYYTTWRNEIQPEAKLQGIEIKHFRETMLTRNNGIEAGLGNWIAGHYMPGVSAQNYDLPTRRIREAIESIEPPACFYDL